MRAIHSAAGLVLLAFAGQAEAARFGYCYVDFGTGAEATRYVTSVVEIGSDPAALTPAGAFGQAFLDHVRSRYESGASSVSCDAWETANDARRAAFEAGIAGDVVRVRTNWLGGMREAGGSRAAKPVRAAKKEASAAAPQAAHPAVASGPPPKKKWEIEFEAKQAVYERELAKQQAAVAEYEMAKAAYARRQAEVAAQTAKERAQWERAVAACKAGDYSACADPPRQ